MDIKKTLWVSWGWVIVATALLIALIALIVIGILNPPKKYYGVVMDQKTSITWEKEGNFYKKIEEVKVFCPEFGTINAIVKNDEKPGFTVKGDMNLIRYRETYPPAQGKTIKVAIQHEYTKLVIVNVWAE